MPRRSKGRQIVKLRKSAADEQLSGSSEMEATRKARAVLRTILSERSEHSPPTSPANTLEDSEQAPVIPNKFR